MKKENPNLPAISNMSNFLKKYLPSFFPLEKRKTNFQRLEVNRRDDHLVLDAPHVNYSYGNLHRVFQHAFNIDELDISTLNEVLILGFGAGSVAHILQKELDCKANITGVEIDPEVIQLANKYFDLQSFNKLSIEIADAFEFVKTAKSGYDLIVVDLFIDHLIPEKFDSPEFLEQINRLLLPGGKVFYNRMFYSHSDKQRTRLFEDVFRQYFPLTSFSQTPSFSNNIVFTARK